MLKISGIVIKGKGKGEKIGFPTVNLKLRNKIESGVYKGVVKVESKNYGAGIFISPDKKILEGHLISFSGDLYGKVIEIEIGEKIRDVMKFDNDEDLKKQIKKDIKLIGNS